MTELVDPYLLGEYQFTEWEFVRERYPRILREGFETYAATLDEELIPAFIPDNNDVGCGDEGVNRRFRIAGSGILFSPQDTAYLLKAFGAERVTSHASCGAATAAARMAGRNDIDQYAIEYAQAVADLAGIEYGGHIPQEVMKRPRLFHNAPVAYIDTTNSFNPQAVPDVLPNGFVISAGNIDPSKQQLINDQVEAIVRIAMDHGIGKRWLSETPFRLVHIRRPDEAYVRPTNLYNIAQRYNGLVVVDTFRAPRPLRRN